MADKTFAQCTEKEKYDWYIRLVNGMNSYMGENSLAKEMLNYYLHPEIQQGESYGIPQQFINKLKRRKEITDKLINLYRPVFLSQKRMPHNNQYGGIATRLSGQKKLEEKVFDGDDNIKMYYEEGVEPSLIDTAGVYLLLDKLKGKSPNQYASVFSNEEKETLDFFLSLHKYGLTAYVSVKPSPLPMEVKSHTQKQVVSAAEWNIKFVSWKNIIKDTYDFNAQVGFKLPNPDYQSTQDYAILPSLQLVDHKELQHNYLVEFTKIGLAKVFEVTGSWIEDREEIIGDAEIDISRFL